MAIFILTYFIIVDSQFVNETVSNQWNISQNDKLSTVTINIYTKWAMAGIDIDKYR